MTDRTSAALALLSSHLSTRRDAILQAWRAAADADPAQTTVSFLTRAQFNDHMPQLLDAFERKLSTRSGENRAAAADHAKSEEMKHGLQRWQQGYQLGELMHEWGHFHFCLFDEIQAFATAHREVDSETIAVAQRELIGLINEGINESAGQYARMQQAEAAGHARDLQRALSKVAAIDQRRAELIRQAVHDLRGNIQSVSTAAEVLRETDIPETERTGFAKLVQQGLEAVSAMLGELTTLARLEAGQEKRELAFFDAASVLRELCTMTQPVAAERGLFLKTEGAAALQVEGDAGKLRRMLQNLLFNALKYTERGGVTVSWGEEKESWWVIVKDTGPGLMAGPSAPMVAGLNEATDSARESDERAAQETGETYHVLPSPPGGSLPAPRRAQQAGEGIGLSIVKRLCELLDASLELVSSADTGTTFRVVLPRRYQIAPSTPRS